MGNVICNKCGSDQTTLLFVGYVCDICEPPKNVGDEPTPKPDGCHPWPGYKYAVASDGDCWTKDKLLNYIIKHSGGDAAFTWDTQKFACIVKAARMNARIVCVSPDNKEATTIFYGDRNHFKKWLENPI